MNCVELFQQRVREHPSKCALHVLGGSSCTFSELFQLSASIQEELKKASLRQGDRVLVFDSLGPRLYAAVIALLGMGCSVLFVEPWMPLARINTLLKRVQPQAFLSSWTGKIWGFRSHAIRSIAKKISLSGLKARNLPLEVVSVSEDLPGIITFSSGTTGEPKGVVRTHQTLVHQHQFLSEALNTDHLTEPDLCIFANFALSNLAAGRCSILMPAQWSLKSFRHLSKLPKSLIPISLTCGPAFLLELMRQSIFADLRHIHVGGALTDCWIFEEGFRRWPKAQWMHVYGSSEAEPVSICDARKAVRLSREAGDFQTLFVGNPIPQLKWKLEEQTAWIHGTHVCPFYLENEESNRKNKRMDQQGRIWHRMGDRIRETEEGWWYTGRSQQSLEAFQLEQSIYFTLQSSKSFLVPEKNGHYVLYGQDIYRRKEELYDAFPQLVDIQERKIRRDHRHRARIDREASMRQGRFLW